MGLSKLLVNGIINFIKLLSRLVFEINVVDDCIYHKFSESKHILLVLYVDNILLASNDIGLLHKTKKFLPRKFEMKDLGNTFFVLGIQMHRITLEVFLDYHKRVISRKYLRDLE